MIKKIDTVAIVPSAGQGNRFGGDKLLALLDDKPVIIHTLFALSVVDSISSIVVVTRGDLIELFWDLVDRYKIKKVTNIVEGGRERQDSVYKGLISVIGEPLLTLIHDGARPLIKTEVIERAIDRLICSNADGIVVGMPVKDTIKEVSEGVIKKTLNRSRLWSAQTPQVFYFKRLLEVFNSAYKDNLYSTDDSALFEHYGNKIIMIEGGYDNIKITTLEDLEYVKSMIATRLI